MKFRCIVALLAMLVPAAAQAQVCAGVTCPPAARGSHLAQTAAVNVALGGFSGGVLAAFRGGSFLRGFAQGAAGGGVTYAGKVVAAGRWQGAGLVGRQVAAIGSSVSVNAAERRAPFGRVMLPLGPVRLHLRTGAGGLRAQPRVDLASAASLVAFATQPGARLDVSASLSDGAPVFRIPEANVDGRHFAGVVSYVMGDDLTRIDMDTVAGTRAHERVHVIQNDQVYLLLGRPLDDALLGSERRGVLRYVDTGAHALLVGATNALVDYEWRPWEDEAYLIGNNRPEPGASVGH